MAIGGPFRELGGFLDACERAACSVNRVQVTEAAEPGDGVPIAADVELLLEPSRSESDAGCSLSSPRIDPDGTVRFALETTREIVPTSEYDVDVELLSARVDASGGGTLSICVQPSTGGGPATSDPATGDSSFLSERGPSDGEVDRRNGHNQSTDSVPPASSPDDESTTEREAGRDVPPFKDPELLAEVYESSDTFAEMADAIEMDVTAETVRRYMIDFDIHQPDSYRTGDTGEQSTDEHAESDGRVAGEGGASATSAGTDDEVPAGGEPTARGVDIDGTESAGGVAANADETASEPVVLSDGLGLPDDVTADTLIETVKRSNTIYEVTQDIDLDRQDAFEMLHDLNLVDLVMGRLATEAEREITREEIVDRLREASATQ